MNQKLLVDSSSIVRMLFHYMYRRGERNYSKAVIDLIRNEFLSLGLRKKDIIFLLDCKDEQGDYWRNKIFPPYKGERKLMVEKYNLEEENIEYEKMFSSILEIISGLFNVVSIPMLEADDLIFILTTDIFKDSRIFIASRDKDLLQLTLYHKDIRFFREERRESYRLFRHIVRGDSADSIPAVFSEVEFREEVKESLRKRNLPSEPLELQKRRDYWDIVRQYTRPFKRAAVSIRKNMTDRDIMKQIRRDERYIKSYIRNRILIDMRSIKRYLNYEAIKYNIIKQLQQKPRYDLSLESIKQLQEQLQDEKRYTLELLTL